MSPHRLTSMPVAPAVLGGPRDQLAARPDAADRQRRRRAAFVAVAASHILRQDRSMPIEKKAACEARR